MKWYHKIGIAFVDKLILALALIFVALSVTPSEDIPAFLTTDAVTILMIVFISYIAVIMFVNLLTLGFRMDSGVLRLALGILSGGFVLWLYPKLLWLLLFFFGLSISQDVETVLVWTIVIRTFLRFYLNRLFSRGE